MRTEPLDAYEAQLAAHLERNDPAAAAAFAAAAPAARREACEIVRDKAQTVAEVWPLVAFLFTEPDIEDVDEKVWRKVMKPGAGSLLRKAATVIADAEPFDAATLEGGLRELIDAEGVSANRVLQPVRVAITGTNVSPGIFESLVALGRERSIARLDRAIGRLGDALPGDDSDPG
jgi:glutamyl-tRNA synthetase